MDKQLVLLTGHRKSGTSMFRNLFDGHTEISQYPTDLNVLYAYFPKFSAELETQSELRARLERVVCDPLEAELAKSLDTKTGQAFRSNFLSAIELFDLRYTKDVINAMINTWRKVADQAERKLTVIKETSADIYASELFSWFPRLKVVHLVRDPRDNYAALKAGVDGYYSGLGEGDKETLASMLFRASIDLRMALLNRARFGQEHYMVVRFEDLTRSPESTMRSIASFLDIDFEETLVTPTSLGHPTAGNNFDKEAKYTVSDFNSGRWRERISQQEAQIIEFNFDGLMQEFGYTPEFSKNEQAEAQAEFYKWCNYKYFFHDSFA